MADNDFKRTCNIVVDGLDQSTVSDIIFNIIQRTERTDDYNPAENIFPTGSGIQITGRKEDGICKICKRFEDIIKNKLQTDARMNKSSGYLDFGYCVHKNLRVDYSGRTLQDRQNLINMFIKKKD